MYLVSQINPFKVLMTNAGSLNDRLAKWSILLSCYDIRYTPAKAIKGQALADFLAEHPLDEDSKFKDDLRMSHSSSPKNSSNVLLILISIGSCILMELLEPMNLER